MSNCQLNVVDNHTTLLRSLQRILELYFLSSFSWPRPQQFVLAPANGGDLHWPTLPQSALELCPIHCPNGRLGQDLGFGGFAFALKLPELLNTNLAAFRAKLGQTSCFPNGPQIWFPIGQ